MSGQRTQIVAQHLMPHGAHSESVQQTGARPGIGPIAQPYMATIAQPCKTFRRYRKFDTAERPDRTLVWSASCAIDQPDIAEPGARLVHVRRIGRYAYLTRPDSKPLRLAK